MILINFFFSFKRTIFQKKMRTLKEDYKSRNNNTKKVLENLIKKI